MALLCELGKENSVDYISDIGIKKKIFIAI